MSVMPPPDNLILTTFDWIPEVRRGYARDIRVRWALEEAGLPYCVQTVSSRTRSAEHYSHQPFGHVPWLTDGDLSIFESGAILLYLGEKTEALMPVNPRSRIEVIEWMFAALNSVETISLPWSMFSNGTDRTPEKRSMEKHLKSRLRHLDAVLAKRNWLTGNFSVADILMADVLRFVDKSGGMTEYSACRDYVTRATERPSFIKAYADQMKHFATTA